MLHNIINPKSLLIVGASLVSLMSFTHGDYQVADPSVVNTLTYSQIFASGCNTVGDFGIYSGHYGVLLGTFTNPSNSPYVKYLRSARVINSTPNSYIFFNQSKSNNGSVTSILLPNIGLVQSLGAAIQPGETYRHLTTAEELRDFGGLAYSFEAGDWTLTNPYAAPNYSASNRFGYGSTLAFSNPNFRAQGHANIPQASYDTQVRALTVYSENQPSGTKYYMNIQCANIKISWCGDGQLQAAKGEVCDNGDQFNGGGNGNQAIKNPTNPNQYCNASCQWENVAPQPPTCTLTANPVTIYRGVSSTLSYASTNAQTITNNTTTCAIAPNTSSTCSVSPQTTTSYSFNVVGTNGSTITCPTATVTVQYCGDGAINGSEVCDPNDPSHAGRGNGGCNATCQPTNNLNPTCSLVPPTQTISLGQSATLTYTNTNTTSMTAITPASRCDFSNLAAGTCLVTPATAGRHTYTYTVNNAAAGTTPQTCNADVVVNQPLCLGFGASTVLINSGGQVTFTGQGGSVSRYTFTVNGPAGWNGNGTYTYTDNNYNGGVVTLNAVPRFNLTGNYSASLIFYDAYNGEAVCAAIPVTVVYPECQEFPALVLPDPRLKAAAPSITITNVLYSGDSLSLQCRGRNYTTGNINIASSIIPMPSWLNPNPFRRYFPNDHVSHTSGHTRQFNQVGNYTGVCSVVDEYGNVDFCVNQHEIIVNEPSNVRIQKLHGTGVFTGVNPLHHYPNTTGYIISYQIIFSNVTSNNENSLYVYDLLATGMNLVSASLSNNAYGPILTGTINGRTYVSLSGFTLNANTSGYLIITGIVTDLTGFDAALNGFVYTNRATLSGNGFTGYDEKVDILHYYPNIDLQKTVIGAQGGYHPGDQVAFRIDFANTGYVAATHMYLSDILPASITNIQTPIFVGGNGVASSVSPTVANGRISYGPFTLAARSAGYIIFTGTVSASVACFQNTLNTAIITGDQGLVDTGFAFFLCSSVPYIQKYQSTGNNQWTSGFMNLTINPGQQQLVVYRINFANNGGTPTNGVVLTDILPSLLSGAQHSIFVYSGGILANASYPNLRGSLANGVIQYSGFDLYPNNTGYMLITGFLQGNANITTYTNTGLLEFFNPYQTGVSVVVAGRNTAALITLRKDLVDASGTQLPDGTTYYPGSMIYFRIIVSNSGFDAYTGNLHDLWPFAGAISCVNTSGRAPISANGNNYLVSGNVLVPGQSSVSFVLSGYIATGVDTSCFGTRMNTGVINSNTTNTVTAIDDVPFVINPLPSVNIQKTGYILDNGKVVYIITFANPSTSAIDSFSITDYRPGTLQRQESAQSLGRLATPSYNITLSTGNNLICHNGSECFTNGTNPTFTFTGDNLMATLRRQFNVRLPAGATGSIVLTGTLK